MRRVLACQPCICCRLPVNGQIYSASLREGGGEHSEPEGAGDINAYHSPQKKHFSFVHAGSSHRYRGPPSSRKRALSLKHPTLTFCSFSVHRQSIFPTTRLSRGFRFTNKTDSSCLLSVFLSDREECDFYSTCWRFGREREYNGAASYGEREANAARALLYAVCRKCRVVQKTCNILFLGKVEFC